MVTLTICKERNGIHRPQCVICHAVLSNDALRPGRLERHLITNHEALKEKPKQFFTAKLHALNPTLETTAKAIDVFSKVDEFFQEHGLSWEQVVGVCTDGAPAMIGSRSGFVKLVKEKNPAVTGTHCVIHRQALASKTLQDLGTDYKTLLFHTEVRWLSKGNMLSRLYELKDEVEIFLQRQKQDKLYEAFTEENFQLSLAYLVDFFEAINNLNLKLQGKNTNIIAHSDVIRAFTEKIHLWKRKVQVGNFSTFSHLNELLSEKRKLEQYDFTKEVLSHLDSLAEEFMRYFPEVTMDNSLWTLVQNPFNTDVELLLDSLQEEAIDLKCDSSAKRDFETMKLEEFWLKYLPMYPKVGEEALRVILPFSSTYLCEAGFSALVVLKTKQRNRLDVANDLRCALSSFKPRISDLVRKKQQHPSHEISS
ncbi:zinc finger BED domain-containing protein 5-like [Portunus trituberculatus]|uniref:zinc finger BED domain-containing protein 5-like n=1 Tax=Portunus trituberculatus TaxID=210409 RepID=UPI001E1CED60|nr:zinc finger BED domain-containing protein 5-like [Portunus trituberculatus]